MQLFGDQNEMQAEHPRAALRAIRARQARHGRTIDERDAG